MPMLPWLICPLAGQARLGQNVVAGSMRILLSWRCWGACQEGVCLDPHFCYKCFSPRLSVELPETHPQRPVPRAIHTALVDKSVEAVANPARDGSTKAAKRVYEETMG